MRSTIIWAMLLATGLCAGCRQENPQQQPVPVTNVVSALSADVLLRFHFLGLDRLASNTNAARLMAIEALPATRAFERQVLAKLARAPRDLLTNSVVFWADDFVPLLQPMLEDLLHAESITEMRGTTGQTAEFVLAIRLEAERAQAWNTNLATILSSWTGIKPEAIRAGNFSGWEVRKHHRPNLIRLVCVNDWVVFGFGQDKLLLHDEFLKQITKRGCPDIAEDDVWFEATADWPRLSPRLTAKLPQLLPANLPRMHLLLEGDGEKLLTRLHMVFPSPVEWSREPWRIPTNLIQDPLISFTTGRGIAPHLNRSKIIQDWEIEPVPNQFCLWAQADSPFRTYLAIPAHNTTNLLQNLSLQLKARLNGRASPFSLGTISWSPDATTIEWRGLPLVMPQIQSLAGVGGEFLLAGIFPNAPGTNAVASDFFARFSGRPNLVYYDWENTPARLTQWRGLGQLAFTLAKKPSLDADSAGAKWLDAVAQQPGKSVTEVTAQGANEMMMIRESAIGLTGFELVALVNWIESSSFPLCGYRLPAHNKEPTAAAPAVNSTHAETRTEH